MSNLKSKLKPAAKQSGIGKSATCPKCYGPAEHYSANYIACPKCDTKPQQKSATVEDSYQDEEADADTNPSISRPAKYTNWTIIPLYQCIACNLMSNYDPADVARGQTCTRMFSLRVCGGHLRRMP